MSFKNWPMIWKVVSLLLLLGGVSLAGAYYATSKLLDVDQTYSDLLDHDASAITKLARAVRFVRTYEAGIYRNIVATTDEGNRAAVEMQAEALKGGQEQVAMAIKLLPADASAIESVDRMVKEAANGRVPPGHQDRQREHDDRGQHQGRHADGDGMPSGSRQGDRGVQCLQCQAVRPDREGEWPTRRPRRSRPSAGRSG